MGIVVVLEQSKITFKEAERLNDGLTETTFALDACRFDTNVSITFDADPHKGHGKIVIGKQPWRIGIVQNVVFEMMHFKYEDGTVFTTDPDSEFKHRILDFDEKAVKRPFYSDHAVADIWYTSQGYGEIGVVNPFTREVETNNQPDSLRTNDTPNIVVTLRLKNGSLIRRAEQVLSFQIWLVAKTPNGPLYLAHFPIFSLVCVVEFTPTGSTQQNLSDDPPPSRPFKHKFDRYGETGITKNIRSLNNIWPPVLHPSDGKGSAHEPHMGESKPAVDRSHIWLKKHGLHP